MWKRILVGTDFSEGANVALEAARALRDRDGAKVAVCHVMPDLGPINILFPQAVQRASLAHLELEKRAQEALQQRASDVLGEPEPETFVEQGVDYERIAARAAAWKADLVVVGSHGGTGFTRALLGSVAERVIRGSTVPVLIARRGGAEKGPVVAATDLSEPSYAALRAAREEADRSGRNLVAVFAAEIPSHPLVATAGLPFGMTWEPVDPRTVSEVEQAAAQSLRSAVELAGVRAETKVVVGPAAPSVIATTEALGAPLLVVSTHGRTGLSKLALGSVAERLVRHETCSVLVVPLEARPAT